MSGAGRTIAGVVGGGAVTGLSVAGAARANSGLVGAGRSLAASTSLRLGQESTAAAQGRASQRRRSEAVVGAVRAIAGERGAGLVGGDRATLLAATLDASRNRRVLNQNLASRSLAIITDAEAQRAQLRAQTESPLLAALSGAVQGAATGFSIVGGGL